MSKYYLYAAAVQGIQDFIFKTNDLKHIVGASELVEQVCVSAFDEFESKDKSKGESVVRAAGNIKYIYQDFSECKKAFREFPKKVMLMAPGITISQAICGYDDENMFDTAIDKVEQLLKAQRNKPPKSVLAGIIGIKRTNNTGLPVTQIKKGEYLDDSTIQKIAFNETRLLCEKSFNTSNIGHSNVAYDIKNITGKNDWIAIIHADGNGLGKVVQKVGKKKDIFKQFSQQLDKATQAAAHAAYNKLKTEKLFDENGVIPIRPVVLSGDDMTVIIRGDLAVKYAKEFIAAFERETQRQLSSILIENDVFADHKDYLTACAGIAFIKSSYPFYFGYQLAEELCGQAKKDTKALAKGRGSEDNLPDSCLMFHKVQDSFITDYEAIEARELMAKVGSESVPLFKAGPYYLAPIEGKHTIDELENLSKRLNGEEGRGVKSGIRNWITLRLEGKAKANQRIKRMNQLFSAADQKTISIITDEKYGTCMAYDVLAYNTIMNQQTNK